LREGNISHWPLLLLPSCIENFFFSFQEILAMFSDFPLAEIKLNVKSGIAGQASIYLEEPELLDEWSKKRVFRMRGQKIPVSPTLSEDLLCVAGLPFDYTQKRFEQLAMCFGKIKNAFLMISEKTGKGLHSCWLNVSDFSLCADGRGSIPDERLAFFVVRQKNDRKTIFR